MQAKASSLGSEIDEIGRQRQNIRRLKCDLSRNYSFYLEIVRYGESETPFISDLAGVMLDETKSAVGTFKAEIIHLDELLASDNSLFFECDAHSEEVCALYAGLLLEDMPLHHLENCACDGLAYLNRLQIHSAHRGQSLGLEICATMVSWFSTCCDIAVMKPFPLQWRGQLDGSPGKERQFQKDRKKLTRYYGPLGFTEAATGNDYYIRELFTTPSFAGIHTGSFRPVKKSEFPSLEDGTFD